MGYRKGFRGKERERKKMIAKGKLTLDEITEYASLPLEVVKELANLQPAQKKKIEKGIERPGFLVKTGKPGLCICIFLII